GRVVAVDASFPMLKVLKEKSWLQGRSIDILRADAHELPFKDHAFHAVISLRMLMHVIDWHNALKEICRLAKQYVIVDFPPRSGFAGFSPATHYILKKIRRNHQPYRVFSIKEITKALNREGFALRAIDRHLVLPFGFHRLVGSVRFTKLVESKLARLGFTDIFGAPVTVLAERVDHENSDDRT
ncbi:methyltransferase domain-containing protein, partial [bacterium]|nr:methyltransferase domain-containing protein [candidate division CSSED10-310 bacterium]